MQPLDRLRDLAEAVTGGGEPDGPTKTASPAAAGGGAATPVSEPGEVSQGGSGMSDTATSQGGADAVPGTPDAVPATRLNEGGEDHPKREDRRSEDVAGQAPSENAAPAERDDV